MTEDVPKGLQTNGQDWIRVRVGAQHAAPLLCYLIRWSTPFTTTASFRATCSLTARTSAWESASPVIPAPGFVMMEKPRQRMPRDRATSTSGAVDIPTASAPSRSSMRTSDGVSYEGPRRRSEEHTSELQSRGHLVCRLLLEKKKTRMQWEPQ